MHSARAAITVFVTWPFLTEYSTALIPLSLSFWLSLLMQCRMVLMLFLVLIIINNQQQQQQWCPAIPDDFTFMRLSTTSFENVNSMSIHTKIKFVSTHSITVVGC